VYYIDDYKKRAVSKIVPYLINFPQIVKLVEYSAERYQAIEDVLWKIAENLRIDESRGIFLESNAVNEVLNLIYTDKAEDAFTYGSKIPLLQGYGKGHYYSQASYISGSRKTASEDKTIRAVKAKVIENNTKGTIQDLIDGLKLYFNADKVGIYESYPMAMSIELIGQNLELSSSGTYDVIKKLLGGCVSLNNIYINKKDFNIFKYNGNSSYGVDRYPIKLNETIDVYQPISNAIRLTDTDKEYIKVEGQTLEDKTVICLMGEFNKIQDEVILSCSDENNLFTLGVSETNIKVVNGGVEYNTNIVAELNKPYTFLLHNDNGSLKLWVLTSVLIGGSNIDRDTSLVLNTIQNTAPIIQVDNFVAPQNDLYVNCKFYVDYETYDPSLFTIVGSPTITDDGVASGFSESDYIRVPYRPLGQNFKIFIPRFNSSDVSQTQKIVRYSDGNFRIEIYQNKIRFYRYTANNVYDLPRGQTTLQNNTDYYYYVEQTTDGTNYYLKGYISTDNKNWTLDIDKTYTSAMYDYQNNAPIQISGADATQPFIGTLDLKQFKITVDGKEVFKNTKHNHSDFTYYLLACGKIDNNSLTTQRYYTTCYGEKNILFNCFDNSNHLTINTQSDLTKNLTVKQSNYNYKDNHSHNRYMYLDGKSYVDYNVSTVSNSCDIEKLELDFDLCLPLELKHCVLLSGFIGNGTTSKVEFNKDANSIVFNFSQQTTLEDGTETTIYDSILIPENTVNLNEYCNFKLIVNGLKALVYKNGFLIKEHDLSFRLQNTPTVVKVGCDQNNENFFNGFLRNVKLDIIGMYKEDGKESISYTTNLNIPLTSDLQDKDKVVDYVNHGARFITVPQLFQNVDNTDLYNNALISNR
jgi:hypothetical protein